MKVEGRSSEQRFPLSHRQRSRASERSPVTRFDKPGRRHSVADETLASTSGACSDSTTARCDTAEGGVAWESRGKLECGSDVSKSSALGAAVRVAQYLRMSTERQEYSPANQAAAIESYAEAHGMAIVRTYCDEGRSGLRLQGRIALQQLIKDIQQGHPGFEAVLVLDVSRWGRFQNADEAAFYEYLCLRSGVRLVYVAEPFESDGTPLSAVLKGLKRSMAAEYSRELSAKVYAGQRRQVNAGFHMGGPPGYGLRQMLVDA